MKKLKKIKNNKLRKIKTKKSIRGLTLIEALIGVAIIGFVVTSSYILFMQSAKLMLNGKQRIGAVALATEKTEFYRNQSYENIPIIDPPEVTDVERSGMTYQVTTSITSIDDPENGVNSEGDYKQIRISIEWTLDGETQEVFFVNNFAPTGISHGTIFVKVFDGDSYSSLEGVLVELSDTEGAGYSASSTTASSGSVLFWGLDENISDYHLKISKDGYETLETYDPDAVSFDPIFKDISLVNGSDSALRYFPLRQTADLKIKTIDESNNNLSGIDIELFGGQKIGNDPDIHDFDDTGSPQTTDSNGEIVYQNTKNNDSKMSPGRYEINDIDNLSKSGFDFIGVKDISHPFLLTPAADQTVELLFVDSSKNSLLIKVTDSLDGASVANAIIRAENTLLAYDETVTTDSLGFAFFRFNETGDFEELVADDYEITVTADGYTEKQATATVNAFSLEEISIDLIE